MNAKTTATGIRRYILDIILYNILFIPIYYIRDTTKTEYLYIARHRITEILIIIEKKQ